MDDRIKQTVVPFILMIILNLGSYYLAQKQDLGRGFLPHMGILLLSGILFGRYGAFGSSFSNLLCHFVRGYSVELALPLFIVNFLISYLSYKLWYKTYRWRKEVSIPQLNNTYNILLFILITVFCGFLSGILHGKLVYLTYSSTKYAIHLIEVRYFFNFINSSIVYGIIGIWFSNKIDFIYIPEKSERNPHKKLYSVLGGLLLIISLSTLIIEHNYLNIPLVTIDLIIVSIILIAYVTKPIVADVVFPNYNSISAKIMNMFHLTTLFIIIVGFLMSNDSLLLSFIDVLIPMGTNEIEIYMMAVIDIVLLIFAIPSLGVLRYIELKVVEPILSFSKIKKFIQENEKIETEGLVNIYSEYIDEDTEIGTLAQSYTDLIQHNNNYIANIQKIEGERKRIEAELDIATRIQSSTLPKGAIRTDEFIVDGYSKPAREVGGDFFDYYMLDEDNLAIIIGDASGKGIPAAILTMITQVTIKQILKHEMDPSKALYNLNNQLCENNTETMFITLWIGIYNKSTKKITFSNAGHNPPLIKENGEFKYSNIDTGIALGVIEDFEYVKEETVLDNELILYTDGITDANNKENEMYGENRLLKLFNEHKNDKNPINILLNDITKFTQDNEQYDDMTLLYLKDKTG